MQTKSKTKKTPVKYIAIIAVSIILVLGLTALAYKNNFFGLGVNDRQQNTQGANNIINEDAPTSNQVDQGNSSKNDTINNGDPKSGSNTTNTPLTPQQDGKSIAQVTISSAATNANILQVRALISTVTSSGTCTLTLTKGTITLKKSSGVQALANSSTCEGFDVPLSELSSGAWVLNVAFENETITGSASRNIEI